LLKYLQAYTGQISAPKKNNEIGPSGPVWPFSWGFSPKKTKKVWTVTVIVQTFLRYSSMSDIFGLAYLVGQVED
jgi:hypothetical protein